MNHAELLNSLGENLRDPERIQFREPNLNGWSMGGDYGSPDILTINTSYSKFVRRIYEVKASNSDMLSDLRKEKWTRYLPICDRLTFAVASGVDFEKHLRPLPVGIMVQRENGTWRNVRAAPVNMKSEPWPENVWMALLFGKMGQRKDTRLDRLEFERRMLLGADLDTLRHSAWKALKEKASELYYLKDELDRTKEQIEERERASVEDHYQKALQQLCKKLNTWAYRPTGVDDVFNRWARDLLKNAFESAEKRLFVTDEIQQA